MTPSAAACREKYARKGIAVRITLRRRALTPVVPGARIGTSAGVTQLVEFLPSKQAVAGSSPVSRSTSLF
jgi:hypothetical protein